MRDAQRDRLCGLFRHEGEFLYFYFGRRDFVVDEELSPRKRKLLLLDAAETLEDLRIPPGNRLERLSGNRQGQHSIRINDQWRICFRWSEGDAYEVEIVDYH